VTPSPTGYVLGDGARSSLDSIVCLTPNGNRLPDGPSTTVLCDRASNLPLGNVSGIPPSRSTLSGRLRENRFGSGFRVTVRSPNPTHGRRTSVGSTKCLECGICGRLGDVSTHRDGGSPFSGPLRENRFGSGFRVTVRPTNGDGPTAFAMPVFPHRVNT